MLYSLLTTIKQIINIYLFLCFVRILLSWVPSAAYSSFGRMLASLCDPYLNWFRRFRFTRVGMVDFSPILSLGILSIAAELISTILATGTISLWTLFVSIIQLIWSFFSFILNLIIVFLIVRLVYDLVGASSNSLFWYNLDRLLNPVIAKVTGFIPPHNMRYRARLVTTIVFVLLIRIILGLLIGSLLVQFYAVRII
jgi:yggt family protein